MRVRHFLLLIIVFLGLAVSAQRIEIEKSCFNTSGDEYGVRLLNNELVVVSSPVIADTKNGLTIEKEFSDLFLINGCNLSTWMLPSAQYEKAINVNSMLNDGPPSVSDSIIFFTVNVNASPLARLGIFYSRKLKNGWSEVIPFALNSKDYNITHPAYDASTDMLYFASDVGGNMDVYAAKFNLNVPQKVELKGLNTTSNEMFPYVFNGILYFTSNRPNGVGGFDLYTFSKEKVELLGDPFNSTYDDLAISWIDSTTGYFSTNRNTNQKNDDVYSFKIVKETPVIDSVLVKEKEVKLQETEIREKIVLLNDSLAKIKAFILSSNLSKELLVLMDRALKNLNISDTTDISKLNLSELQHLYSLLNITSITLVNSIKNEENTKITTNTVVDSLNTGPTVPVVTNTPVDSLNNVPTTNTNVSSIEALNELIKSSKIELIQFKFNSSIIPEEYKQLISGVAVLMKTDSRIKINIDGHTDNVGDKDYNMYLSQLRAESVSKVLRSKGITSDRIFISYYGLEKPIADNSTEQGRYLNRRVEMKLTY